MRPVHRLTAILAADVAGYLRSMGADEKRAQTISDHHVDVRGKWLLIYFGWSMPACRYA
jgi:hypothetical protein